MHPDTDNDKMIMVFKFINAVVKKCDKIVIGRKTPFVFKFYRYMKVSGQDFNFKKRLTKLNQLLFHNLDKTIIIEEIGNKQLPNEIESEVPPDDKYLIELALFSKNSIIVTTDQRLKNKLHNKTDLKIYLLEEFLKEYL
jgi:predicted nucleic acid-binding protein